VAIVTSMRRQADIESTASTNSCDSNPVVDLFPSSLFGVQIHKVVSFFVNDIDANIQWLLVNKQLVVMN